MIDLRKVVAAYGGTGSGNQCNIPTPGHSRRDLGTSITLKSGAPDGVLVKCHNGSDADALAVKDMLRRDGFLTERQPPESGNDNGAKWRCTGTYEYDDGDGQVIYRTRRLERTGNKKRFVAERFEGAAWVSGLDGVERLPYRFTELCRAAENARESGDPQPVIYFTEGERKADKLASWGFLATAIAFGCKGWREEYGEAFTGSTVIILPDNDEPGHAFAETVKAGIESYGGSAQVLDLPGLPAAGDIMDWTGTADDLRKLTAKVLAGALLPLPTLDLAELATVKPQAKQFAIERLAPLAEVTIFTGPGSSGKSLLGQQLATAAAAGVPCLGLDVMACPAIYLTCEDDADQLHWRQQHICEAMHLPMAGLAGRLHLSSLRGGLDNELGTYAADGKLSLAPAYRRIAAMIEATGAKLVFLDNLAHLFTGNENDRGNVTRFVNLLNRLAGDTGAAILLLGHPNKNGDSYSGSTAWLNAVRSQITIDHERDSDGGVLDMDARVLTIGKANYARKGEALRFRWHNWAFVLDDDLPADTRAELSEAIKASSENAAFLACLRERASQGEGRGVGPSIGPNYAPTQFQGMAQAKGYRKAALKRAMDRLFSIGAIESHTYRNTAKGRDVTIIREVPDGTPNASPNASRTPFPNDPEQCDRTTPRTHSIYKYIPGAGLGAPTPDYEDDDLDWRSDGEVDE